MEQDQMSVQFTVQQGNAKRADGTANAKTKRIIATTKDWIESAIYRQQNQCLQVRKVDVVQQVEIALLRRWTLPTRLLIPCCCQQKTTACTTTPENTSGIGLILQWDCSSVCISSRRVERADTQLEIAFDECRGQ